MTAQITPHLGVDISSVQCTEDGHVVFQQELPLGTASVAPSTAKNQEEPTERTDPTRPAATKSSAAKSAYGLAKRRLVVVNDGAVHGLALGRRGVPKVHPVKGSETHEATAAMKACAPRSLGPALRRKRRCRAGRDWSKSLSRRARGRW